MSLASRPNARSLPAPGSREELQHFSRLQERLAPLYERVFPDRMAERTVIVNPSLTLDVEVMDNISGVRHYEERMLCMLMLLRLPRTNLVYLSSEPVDPTIIDYYLHLLPGIPSDHARRRLTLLSCHDGSRDPLTLKILERPRLIQRIRESIPDPDSVHMTCFAASPLERTLAVRLNVPVYACDPALNALGSKSGSREVFREAGIPMPDGIENLRDELDLVEAMNHLKTRNPGLRRAVVKLNEGFSGEGNAVYDFDGPTSPVKRVDLEKKLQFEAEKQSWESFRDKFREMGGIVECFVNGGGAHRSPSVQCRINPMGETEVISTHEQVLGGPSNQIFLGCAFPADDAYRVALQEAGLKVAKVLRDRGAVGRFGVDFVSLEKENGWEHWAIEINLRKGGTTHPYMMLQFLTDGSFETKTGLHRTPTGQARYYFASDNLQSREYKGLTPTDLIEIAVDHNLHFHGASQQGVVFHLIGALSEFGKLGMVCVGDSREGAQKLYYDAVAILDREAAHSSAESSFAPRSNARFSS